MTSIQQNAATGTKAYSSLVQNADRLIKAGAALTHEQVDSMSNKTPKTEEEAVTLALSHQAVRWMAERDPTILEDLKGYKSLGHRAEDDTPEMRQKLMDERMAGATVTAKAMSDEEVEAWKKNNPGAVGLRRDQIEFLNDMDARMSAPTERAIIRVSDAYTAQYAEQKAEELARGDGSNQPMYARIYVGGKLAGYVSAIGSPGIAVTDDGMGMFNKAINTMRHSDGSFGYKQVLELMLADLKGRNDVTVQYGGTL